MPERQELNMRLTTWKVDEILKRRKDIDDDIWWQRGKIWSKSVQRLFIDSLFKGYDVPLLYFNVTGKGTDSEQYQVIDGKQRINAIMEFFTQKIKLDKQSEDIGLKNKNINQIPTRRLEVEFYYRPIHVVEVYDGDIEGITELFRRLQKGSRLTTPETLNSIKSKMGDFCWKIAKRPFFKKTSLSSSRYGLFQSAIQTAALIKNGLQNLKYKDLEKFLKNNVDFNASQSEALEINRVFDLLDLIYPNQVLELRSRASIVSLVYLITKIKDDYVITGREKEIGKFYIDFLNKVEEEKLKGINGNPRFLTYDKYVIQAADTTTNIRERHKILEEEFFYTLQDIQLKDRTRTFTQQQRVAIFRKANSQCQGAKHVGDRKLDLLNWHADHITPHTKAGPTIVENGQALCPKCNLSKGAD